MPAANNANQSDSKSAGSSTACSTKKPVVAVVALDDDDDDKTAASVVPPAVSAPRQQQSSPLSRATVVGCFVVAALSFGAGLITPPFLARLLQTAGFNNGNVPPPQYASLQSVAAAAAVDFQELSSMFRVLKAQHDQQLQDQQDLQEKTTTTFDSALTSSGAAVTTTRQPHKTDSQNSVVTHFPCSNEFLSQFWHESFIRGMHVMCVETQQSDDNESVDGSDTFNVLRLRFYAGSRAQREKVVDDVEPRWNALRELLVKQFQLRRADDMHQPWAIFSPLGEFVVDETMKDNDVEDDDDDTTPSDIVQRLVQMGVVLVFQGGQWIWPGIRIGFQRSVDLFQIAPRDGSGSRLSSSSSFAAQPQPNRTAWLETLSLRPLVLSVQGFLTDDECDYIQAKAEPTIKYSTVSLMDKDEGRPASDFRTSQSTFVTARSDPILRDIEYRTASLVRMPRQHQEDVQVLRYGVTEHYSAHHDYFAPQLYKNDFWTQQTIQNGRRNRMATVFWYLSTVEKGGETIFPRFNNTPPPQDMADCSLQGVLKVKPQRGKVIIFYNMDSKGHLDPLSLHGACPVEQGIKWAANKWVWNAPMDYIIASE